MVGYVNVKRDKVLECGAKRMGLGNSLSKRGTDHFCEKTKMCPFINVTIRIFEERN